MGAALNEADLRTKFPVLLEGRTADEIDDYVEYLRLVMPDALNRITLLQRWLEKRYPRQDRVPSSAAVHWAHPELDDWIQTVFRARTSVRKDPLPQAADELDWHLRSLRHAATYGETFVDQVISCRYRYPWSTPWFRTDATTEGSALNTRVVIAIGSDESSHDYSPIYFRDQPLDARHQRTDRSLYFCLCLIREFDRVLRSVDEILRARRQGAPLSEWRGPLEQAFPVLKTVPVPGKDPSANAYAFAILGARHGFESETTTKRALSEARARVASFEDRFPSGVQMKDDYDIIRDLDPRVDGIPAGRT